MTHLASQRESCFAAYFTKSGLRVFGFCPAGSTSKMEFNQVLRHDSGLSFNRPGVDAAYDFPVGIQKVSGYSNCPVLVGCLFVQILADDDNFNLPISEMGVPCLINVTLVLMERRELSP